jgi:hypothetical protein
VQDFESGGLPVPSQNDHYQLERDTLGGLSDGIDRNPLCDFGAPAPDFALPGVDGRIWTRDQCKGPRGLLVMFICNHCPYVKAIRDRLVRDARELAALGIGCVAISSNDVNDYPEDSFDHMKQVAEAVPASPSPTSTTKARRSRAPMAPSAPRTSSATTASWASSIAVGSTPAARRPRPPDVRRDLFEAMKQVAETGNGPAEQIPSMGCSIKWKAH